MLIMEPGTYLLLGCERANFLLYSFRFVRRLLVPAPGTTAVPCKRVPRTRHIVSGTYISCTRYRVSWILYLLSRILDLDLLSGIWNDNYGTLDTLIAWLLASFGLEFLFSDFELGISESSGVSHSKSCRWTAVSYLLYGCILHQFRVYFLPAGPGMKNAVQFWEP